jgi:hypothetical protein
MRLINEEFKLEIEAQQAGPPEDANEPFGRGMQTPQQMVDDPDNRYMSFCWLKVVGILQEPPKPADEDSADDDPYHGPVHNEIVAAYESTKGICRVFTGQLDGTVTEQVFETTTQPILAFVKTYEFGKPTRVILEWGDAGVEMELVERTAHNIAHEADDLWTEWRVMHDNDPLVFDLPADPPALGDEVAWDACLTWYNDTAQYGLLSDDQVAEALIEQRVSVNFGDGQDRDYAIEGQAIIGRPIRNMSREQMTAELIGEEPTGRLGDDEEHTIGIDFPMCCTTGDLDEAQEHLEVLGQYNLWFMMKVRVGPGGGNPYVELRGKVGDLRKWLADRYCGGVAGQGSQEALEAEVNLHLWGE